MARADAWSQTAGLRTSASDGNLIVTELSGFLQGTLLVRLPLYFGKHVLNGMVRAGQLCGQLVLPSQYAQDLPRSEVCAF